MPTEKPKSCLREQLAILLKNPEAKQLPKCDSKGLYLPKQCELVTSTECPSKGRKKRAATCGEDIVFSQIGFKA
jgi:hypothetical protein